MGYKGKVGRISEGFFICRSLIVEFSLNYWVLLVCLDGED